MFLAWEAKPTSLKIRKDTVTTKAPLGPSSMAPTIAKLVTSANTDKLSVMFGPPKDILWGLVRLEMLTNLESKNVRSSLCEKTLKAVY